MADNRQGRVEKFYRENKNQILASARRLDSQCPEDLIQTVLALWLRPTRAPQFTVMAFVRQMELLVFEDGHHRPGSDGGNRPRVAAPTEVHGDIDQMWRRRHGRRTGVKGGAE